MPKQVTHYDYGGLPLCDTAHKAPALNIDERRVTCAKCLHRFNSGEDCSDRSGAENNGGPDVELGRFVKHGFGMDAI